MNNERQQQEEILHQPLACYSEHREILHHTWIICEQREAAEGRDPLPYLDYIVNNERQQQEKILYQTLDVMVDNERQQQEEILHQS